MLGKTNGNDASKPPVENLACYFSKQELDRSQDSNPTIACDAFTVKIIYDGSSGYHFGCNWIEAKYS